MMATPSSERPRSTGPLTPTTSRSEWERYGRGYSSPQTAGYDAAGELFRTYDHGYDRASHPASASTAPSEAQYRYACNRLGDYGGRREPRRLGRLAYGYIDLVDLLFDRFVPRWTTLILIIIGTFVGVRYAGDPGIPAWAAAGFGGAAGAFAIPVLRLAVKLLPLAVIGGGISLLLR